MSQCHDTYEDLRGVTASLPVRATDLMTPNPVVVEPTATVKDIAQAMLHHDVRTVPVIDVGDRLVGVVSEADLICREGYPTVRHHNLAAFVAGLPPDDAGRWTVRSEGLTAEEVMTTGVVTCQADEPVGAVARRMLERDVRTVPVIDQGRLVGVLSRHDILRMFVRPDGEVRQHISRILDTPAWGPGHDVSAEVRDGVVVLSGTVEHPVDASVICSVVGQVPGVIEVVDRIIAEAELDRLALGRSSD